jgi:hypothetical protein
MSATVSPFRNRLAALLLLVSAPISLGAQQGPLRKTDLIRMLTGRAYSPAQIAEAVQRSCLSFTPTARDRANLVDLGADSAIMARIDACVRSHAAAAPARVDTPVPPPPPPPAAPAPLVAVPLATRVSVPLRGTALVSVALKRGTQAVAGTRLVLYGTARLAGPGASDVEAVTDQRGIAEFRFPAGGAAGTVRLTVATVGADPLDEPAAVDLTVVAPAPALVAAAPPRPAAPGQPASDRTGFVLGMGQHGRVGEAAPLPLVFEVRDSAGLPLRDIAVTLSATNGRLVGAAPRTDSLGQVRAQVVFGERAGVATVVTGTAGGPGPDGITRETSLYPSAGDPSQLVVLLDGNAVVGQVVMLAHRAVQLRIFCRDRFGNTLPLTGLRATVGDDKVVQVTEVTSDALGGTVTVGGTRSGSTNLVVQGSGLRADFSALVQ